MKVVMSKVLNYLFSSLEYCTTGSEFNVELQFRRKSSFEGRKNYHTNYRLLVKVSR